MTDNAHPLAPGDGDFLDMALAEAEAAAARGEVPVGAVLTDGSGGVLARSGNRIVERHDPTAHAEILAIREAARALGNERLTGTRLFVSLEPCAMCAGAIAMARIAEVIFAAPDPKGGAIIHGPRFFAQSTCHHRPAVRMDEEKGVYAARSSELLKGFFRMRRKA